MYIYSGKVRVGLVGTPTPLVDGNDKPLFVGDICVVCHRDGYIPDSLTVVVEGSNTYGIDDPTPFIMGLRNADLKKDWYVLKVKSYEDVIAGEHWKAFGFNYQES